MENKYGTATVGEVDCYLQNDIGNLEDWLVVYHTKVNLPEQRLCLAMLERAIADLDDPRYRPEVIDWIKGIDTEGTLNLTFEFACLCAGFNDEFVRRKLLAQGRDKLRLVKVQGSKYLHHQTIC